MKLTVKNRANTNRLVSQSFVFFNVNLLLHYLYFGTNFKMKIALNKTSSFRNIITLSNNEVKIVTKIQYGVDIGDTSTETRYMYTK